MTRQFRFPFIFSGDRVIDVGSEWRTFSNDKATKDPSRVGDSQNPLLSDGDLSTMIGKVINPLGRKCQVQTDQRPGVGNFAKLSVTVPVRNLYLRVRSAVRLLVMMVALFISSVLNGKLIHWSYRLDISGPCFNEAVLPKKIECCRLFEFILKCSLNISNLFSFPLRPLR